MIKSAALSACHTYRYALWRTWGDGPYCVFVGLNPSTADEVTDDPTIRKCFGFCQRWGYSSLCMVNLFAFRATQPADMKRAADPVGPENDRTLAHLTEDAGLVVTAWGKDGTYRNRASQVMPLLHNPSYLRLNGDGTPAHPLYLPYELKPTPWNKPDTDWI